MDLDANEGDVLNAIDSSKSSQIAATLAAQIAMTQHKSEKVFKSLTAMGEGAKIVMD